MTVSTITSRDPFRLTLASAADVEDGEVVLTAENLVGATSADVVAGIADATEALANTQVVWRDVAVAVAATTAGVVYVVAPVTGTVTSIVSAVSADPGGAVAVAADIGGVAITNGALTIANGAAAGEIDSATPTAANSVTAGTSAVGIAWDNGAANPVLVTFSVAFTRA